MFQIPNIFDCCRLPDKKFHATTLGCILWTEESSPCCHNIEQAQLKSCEKQHRPNALTSLYNIYLRMRVLPAQITQCVVVNIGNISERHRLLCVVKVDRVFWCNRKHQPIWQIKRVWHRLQWTICRTKSSVVTILKFPTSIWYLSIWWNLYWNLNLLYHKNIYFIPFEIPRGKLPYR